MTEDNDNDRKYQLPVQSHVKSPSNSYIYCNDVNSEKLNIEENSNFHKGKIILKMMQVDKIKYYICMTCFILVDDDENENNGSMSSSDIEKLFLNFYPAKGKFIGK